MKDEGYIVFTKNGLDRLVKGLPKKLSAGEYAVRILLDVPDGLFTPPIPTATLTVPASAALAPPVTVDLGSMEEVCLVETGVAFEDPDVKGRILHKCPKCGFVSWNQKFGPHYRPTPKPKAAVKA
jgi:hypothetical protein